MSAERVFQAIGLRWHVVDHDDRRGFRIGWCGPTGVLNVFDAKNQMTNLDPGRTYDNAGNQAKYSPFTLTYDAENRLVSMTSTSSGAGTYLCDGEGRRVLSA